MDNVKQLRSLLQSQLDKHTRRSKTRSSELAGAYVADSTTTYALGAHVDYASDDSTEFHTYRPLSPDVMPDVSGHGTGPRALRVHLHHALYKHNVLSNTFFLESCTPLCVGCLPTIVITRTQHELCITESRLTVAAAKKKEKKNRCLMQANECGVLFPRRL